jgi:hypothetical protein
VLKIRWWEGKDPRVLADEGTEVWAPIPGATRYAVSNLGRVFSSARGDSKLLTLATVGAGYRAVGILADDGARNGGTLVHRLAVQAFDGPAPTPEHTDVRHLDGDKANNALPNLLWGTRSENMKDVLLHRQQQGQDVATAERARAEADAEASGGAWYGGRTWDTELVEAVTKLERAGHLLGRQAADLLGVSIDVISNMALGRSHEHLDIPQQRKQLRRTKRQKEAIMQLVRKGKNAAEINEALGETLTAQAVNYYRQKAKLET